MIQSLYRNEELIDFVYNYPSKKRTCLYRYNRSSHKGRYPLLLQYDPRWGYGKYGYNVIGMNGCGPKCCNDYCRINREEITYPFDGHLTAYSHGYYQDGTSWAFFTEGMKHYGSWKKHTPLLFFYEEY